MSEHVPLVVVSGDLLVDHHLYDGVRCPTPLSACKTRLENRPGGAGLTSDLLAATARLDGERAWSVELNSDRPPSEEILPESFAVWRLRPQKPGDERNLVWRLSDPLGYGRKRLEQPLPRRQELDDATASVIVLDDGNQGYRRQSSGISWPSQVRSPGSLSKPWIVLKMGSPLAQGDLWRTLRDNHSDRLVVVVSIDDIRREQVLVTKGMSWERTALDLAFELQCNPAIKDLLRCRHLVISLGLEGALLVSQNSTQGRSIQLIYDPQYLEGESNPGMAGTAVGFATCLTAAIARQLAVFGDLTNSTGANGDVKSAPVSEATMLLTGIRFGLNGMRRLRELGHGPSGSEPGFPFESIASIICGREKQPPTRFEVAEVPAPDETCQTSERTWTIVTASQDHINVPRIPLYGLAARVARGGLAQFGGVPFVRYGKLFTVDRTEIESLQAIQRLMIDYLRSDHEERPLSLAVFGPPGAGKSFGVKQLAKEIYFREYRKAAPVLEFNLSQFVSSEELVGAFQVVRDKVLEGVTPLVFWDEFDSGGYKWLQNLLAPMQDGKFNEGQLQHPLGKCIFVFAGGTSFDFENFGPNPADREAVERFKLKKGPDFKSRLSGYLNVLGPNPRLIPRNASQRHTNVATAFANAAADGTPEPQAGEAAGASLPVLDWVDDDTDICFPLRRALLIRSALGAEEGSKLDIDSGILTALLELKHYRHGARSLEKILLHMKTHRDGQAIRRSALPPRELVAMHTDYNELRRIANRDLAFQSLALEMAPRIHADWRTKKRAKLPHNPPPAEENNFRWDLPWEKLPIWLQEENVAAAVRISRMLGMVGLQVVPQDDPSPDETPLVRQILELYLEFLAEEEHSGWMEHKLLNDWHFSPDRNDDARAHDNLVPYSDLKDDVKQYDRNSILHIPETVAVAGYRVIRVGNEHQATGPRPPSQSAVPATRSYVAAKSV